MKSKVRDQVEIGIFSQQRSLLTWKTHTHTHRHTHTYQIHTLQLPGADTHFISSNAYIKMKMYRTFQYKKEKKQGVDILTRTPAQHSSIQCNRITRNTTVEPIFRDCLREMLIHLADCSLHVVAFGLCFIVADAFCVFEMTYWCTCYCVHILYTRISLVLLLFFKYSSNFLE